MPRFLTRRLSIILASATFAIGIPFGIVLAGATFNDVPPSNPFYNDITALANSGVTGGCGGGNFCPKDNVTREQMAAFMNRLGALQAGKTPVVNADEVDGYDATDLARVSFAQDGGIDALPAQASAALFLSTSLTLPGPGYVFVSASVTTYSFDAGCGCEAAFQVTDGTTNSIAQRARVGSAADSTEIANVAPQYVFTYTSGGAKTFSIRGWNFNTGAGDANVQHKSITAQYVPFGSTGSAPTVLAPAPPSDFAPSGE